MYFITQTQWQSIPDDYKTEKSRKGARAVFEGCLNDDGRGGTSLLFEHEQFVIVPDEIADEDPEKDALTRDLLKELTTATPGQRAEWITAARTAFKDDPDTITFIETAATVADAFAG